MFVVASFVTGQRVWIGLRHRARVWSDGSNATYFGSPAVFNSTPSEENCYMMVTVGLNWFVISCNTGLKHAVCKRMGLYRTPEVISSLDQLYAFIIY